MTLESALQVDNVNPTTEISLHDIDGPNKKYSADQFYKDLEKAQQQDVSIGREDPRYANRPTDISEVTNREEHVPIQDNPLDEEAEQINEEQNAPWEEEEDLGHGPIPKKRFNKEIEKRKILEEQLRSERDTRIKMETELSLFNKALEEASKPKSKDESRLDPIDNDAHDYYVKEINELKHQLKQQNEYLSHEQQQQQLNNALLQQRNQFMQKQPDFDQAYQHVFEAEVQRNELIGYPKEEAMRVADQHLMAQAVKALQVGKDVPAMIYQTAKAFGYNPKANVAQKQTGPNLRNIERNIKKSETILNDIAEVSSRPAPEATAYVSNDGFARHLMNKDGRGVDADAFRKAVEKLRSGM